MKKHLWEVDHPYYCSLSNYFDNNCGDGFESWGDFIAKYRNADFDMNLLFRWDWLDSTDPDQELEGDELRLFWMGQRKGLYRFTVVQIERGDEPLVIEWLHERRRHLLKLWEPLREEEPHE